MSRYIDAEKIKFEPIDIIVKGITRRTIERMATETEIDAMPTADVEEVKHGKWSGEMNRITYYCATCNNCGWIAPCLSYCGMCGAKMVKEKEE